MGQSDLGMFLDLSARVWNVKITRLLVYRTLAFDLATPIPFTRPIHCDESSEYLQRVLPTILIFDVHLICGCIVGRQDGR